MSYVHHNAKDAATPLEGALKAVNLLVQQKVCARHQSVWESYQYAFSSSHSARCPHLRAFRIENGALWRSILRYALTLILLDYVW